MVGMEIMKGNNYEKLREEGDVSVVFKSWTNRWKLQRMFRWIAKAGEWAGESLHWLCLGGEQKCRKSRICGPGRLSLMGEGNPYFMKEENLKVSCVETRITANTTET